MSEPNSGKRDCRSEELSRGEIGYSSEVESGFAQTESMVGRQLQLVETVAVTSLGGGGGCLLEALFLLLVVSLCLDDFLGGSGKWVSVIFGDSCLVIGGCSGGGVSSLVK